MAPKLAHGNSTALGITALLLFVLAFGVYLGYLQTSILGGINASSFAVLGVVALVGAIALYSYEEGGGGVMVAAVGRRRR